MGQRQKVSLKTACHVVETNHPNRCIVRCFDYDSFYGFMTVLRNWSEKSMELPSVPANNSMNYIRKEDGTEVDIKDYLSSEDVAFATKVKESINRH